MYAAPRTELRYNITSKTTKDDLKRIVATQGQELVNTADRAYQAEVALEAAKATIHALKDELAKANAEVERHASMLRKSIAQQRRALNTPAKEDIMRCCEALGVKSVTPAQLQEWLRANPR